MLKTTKMQMVELMMLRQDVDRVLEYLGTKADFEMRERTQDRKGAEDEGLHALLSRLQTGRAFLGLPDPDSWEPGISLPAEGELQEAESLAARVEELQEREKIAREFRDRVADARDEAKAFANLKVSFSELDHLTFLSIRVGRLDPAELPAAQAALGDRALLVPLGTEGSRILAASSRKGRFALDTELKRFGFVPMEIPETFTGIPDEILAELEREVSRAETELAEAAEQRMHFTAAVARQYVTTLQKVTLATRVTQAREGLESTRMVYRVSGWIPASESGTLMHELDNLTEGRIAIRVWTPDEVPEVRSGTEKVPVRFSHGPMVRSFERVIFSYGAPLYGTVDPTPIVAFFFTLLFGIMFGDVGQGVVFALLGLALSFGGFKTLKKWAHFGPVFVCIGVSSMVMGLLTGEFFANGEVLAPLSRAITGYFGEPRDRILELMPTHDSLGKLMVFFAFTLGVGFVLNSIGLIINIVNQFFLRRPARALFSKTGVAGASFFWYAVFLALRFGLSRRAPLVWEWILLALPLLVIFMAEPLTRLAEGHRPVFENGLFSGFIEGIVELLETFTTYFSNSVSYLRVGAFALSHGVLSFIVFTMTDLVGGSLSLGGIAVEILGNGVIIVLEGLIVAIQVVRLQYYEFFSKFFAETGKEFKPFRFSYKEH